MRDLFVIYVANRQKLYSPAEISFVDISTGLFVYRNK